MLVASRKLVSKSGGQVDVNGVRIEAGSGLNYWACII